MKATLLIIIKQLYVHEAYQNKKFASIYFTLWLSYHTSLALYVGDNNSKNIKLSITAGAGVSYFHYDVRNFNHKIHGQRYQFEAPNFRFGLLADQPTLKNVSIKGGLRVGVRFKRKPLYENYQPGLIYPYSFFGMDEQVSKSNSYFYEVPVSIVYTKQKIKIGAGVIYHASISVLAEGDGPDWGLIPSLAYSLSERLTVGVEYFYAVNKKGIDYVHDDNGRKIPFNYRNQFVHATIEYKLKMKK